MKLLVFQYLAALVAVMTVAEARNVQSEWPRYIPGAYDTESFYNVHYQETTPYTKSEGLITEGLKTGQVIEVVYKNPTDERVTVNLLAGSDYAMYIDARISWGSDENKLFFGYYTSSTRWVDRTPDTMLGHFPFTCPPVQTTISTRINVNQNDFEILVNGILVGRFKFQANLTPEQVTKIECKIADGNASVKGAIESIKVSYA